MCEINSEGGHKRGRGLMKGWLWEWGGVKTGQDKLVAIDVCGSGPMEAPIVVCRKRSWQLLKSELPTAKSKRGKRLGVRWGPTPYSGHPGHDFVDVCKLKPGSPFSQPWFHAGVGIIRMKPWACGSDRFSKLAAACTV